MGRKLDLSGLSDNEAEHVLQVVQRDMKLRKKEEERLSELKQELDDEGSRCLLLSRQGYFNQRCCIRCCSPFTFLLNPKRKCHDCKYNVCKACRVYSKREKAWLCSSCEKSRLLKTQNLEWFYTNVKTRFKRFGSAKVLKTLYRKHLVEHSTLSELTEGSTYEESICNEGSISGSDSAFYRQSEEHSMEETLTVALRVAEEALDEAITKAEFDTSSQEKQNEAHYLREHKGELVEELAKTIVQKIINRRKTLADMRAEYVQDWPVEHNTDLHHHHQSASDRATSSVKQQPGLFRSHSAFSLLENDSPGMVQDSSKASMKEDGGPAMTAWKSVDRLDNAGVSAVLHSMDGNWIALQSAQLSRPSLLTKRKSQVYSALERESAVVSAYEGMGSDNDIKHGSDSSLGTALQEVHRKMVDSNMDLQDTCDRILSPLMSRRASGDKILSPMLGRRSSRDIMLADSEGNWKPNKPLLGVIKLKVPAEIRRPPSRRTSIIDMNFNTEGARQEENMGAAERSQQKKKSEKESSSLNNRKKDNHPPEALTPDTLSSGGMTTPEILELETDITGQVANQMDQELTAKLEQLAGRVDDSSTGEEKEAVDGDAVDDGRREEEEDKDRDEEDEQQQRMEVESDEGRTEDEEKEEEERNEEDDEEINYRLNKLITHSRLKYFSSTDEELDKAGKSEEEEEEGEGEGEGDKDEDTEEEQKEEREEKTNGFTFKLCQLEKESRAYQFSSTEDEMDRVGIEEKTEDEEENGKNVELAVKVCRLAYQVNANQFSSTEDELDSVGLLDEDMKTGEEEEEEEDEKKEELALKVCRLAHQVNASQFSSTEDELDRVGRGEEEEEGTDEEALWKLRAEKAVQAAHMRDLASLVGASEFSSTEDNLDKVGQTGQEVNKVTGSDMWENAEGNNQDKEESFEDLDVNMFDLRDEIEEKKKGSSDETVEEKKDGKEDGVTEQGEVLKDTEKAREAEMELKTVEEGKELIKVVEENQPGARQEDDKIEESNGSQGSWETAKDEENSEEYAEFDRIISSMLMMTLEDMQVQTVNDEAGENGGNVSEQAQVKVDENVKIEGGSGSVQMEVDREVTIGNESELMHVEVDEEVQKGGESELEHVKVDGEVQTGEESGLENVELDVEFMIDAQSTEDTKETESKKELESPNENAPQSYAKENPEANIQKQEESEDAKCRKDNEQGKETDPHSIRSPAKTAVMSIKEMLETYEAKQLCQRIGLHDDKQQDRGGKVSTMRLMMETQGDVTETKERMEETEGKKTYKKDQSRRSSLDDGLQTPEEIQMSSSAVQRIGLHDDKQDIGGKVSTMLHMMEAQSDIAETKERMEETKGKKTYKKDQSRRSSLDDVLQTPEEIQMRYSAVQRIGLHDDKQDIGGKVSTMLQMMEAQSDIAETKERMEETKGKKTYKKDQSRRSSLDDVLQTPEEIQMRYSAVQRIGLHDDKQDIGGKVSTMLHMMEAQSDVTETKERMEETKGKKTYKKDQSRRSSLDDVLQTPEEIQMRYSAVQRIGLHDEKQDIGGKVSTMLHMMEAQSDVTETKERMEETKGKKTYKKDQSRRSSLDDVLQTPEEIQMRYSAAQRIGLHDDKQDKGGKVSSMLQMMEAQSDVTEERMEETKGKKTYKKDQSRRSSLDDVLQTPEEIQMDSDMDICKTLEFISTLLEQRYSAVQLRTITTEVLKVLNTTEDLLHGVKGGDKLRSSTPSLPPNTDPRKLDQQFSKLEENVYVAAGSVYSLEAELGDLEECARSISGSTSDMELSFLEEQVASAAAKVQQSDLQICDISARIAALKNAGLNVDTQSRPTKARTIPVMPVTLDSSRQFRRRLPAPPVKDKET